MASVQERHNISRVALEKWTKREQLCLASAVSCSGDQNWMTVSRSLKLLCGAHHPPDWFSQKLCAVKYGELLENVETPKRKKRTTSDSASNIVETPTDSILRRLTEERIQELKSEIREQQETYAKLYTDVVHLQTGNSNEEQIRAMWMEIEREQEQDRQSKARKLMNTQELQRNWRQSQFQTSKIHISTTPVKQEQQDMDIDETCKPQGTSPLLSSLLKSSSPAPVTGTTTTTSTVRVTAPTIANLLIGGVMSSVPTSASSSATSQASGLLTQVIPLSKPLTGPGPGDSYQSPTQTVLSPSQSAPTLSMLLEKINSSKDSPQEISTTQQLVDEIKTEPAAEPSVDESAVVKLEDEAVVGDETMGEVNFTPTKEEEQQLMEVFKNLIPDNIDELADILTNNHGILNPEILEEESILDGVESLMDEAQEVNDQLEAKLTECEIIQDSKNPPRIEEESGAKIKIEQTPENDSKRPPSISQPESTKITDVAVDTMTEEVPSEPSTDNPKNEMVEKIETISSDDSSDNVPLAIHSKDTKLVDATAKEVENLDGEATAIPNQSTTLTDEAIQSQQVFENTAESTSQKKGEDEVAQDDEEFGLKNDQSTLATRKCSLSDSSDVIIIRTDDESNDGKMELETKKSFTDSAVEISSKEDENKTNEELSVNNPESTIREIPLPQQAPITSICLPDTDDESSTFETPTTTSKEDKLNQQKQLSQNKKNESDVKIEEETKQTLAIRKLRDRDRSESPLVEDDASDHSITVRSRRRYSSTPATDSIPNSPSSSDDREFKVWKKSLMTVYNNLLTNKNAVIFLRPFTEEQTPRYKQVCNRPMDLQIIKRNIENGRIRNVIDFQRDVFLMCHNAILVFSNNSSYANMAKDLMHDFVQLRDQIIDAKMDKEKSYSASSPYTAGVKVRGSARKSQRLP